MILKIIFGALLTISTMVFGGLFWEIVQRNRFIREMLNDEEALSKMFTQKELNRLSDIYKKPDRIDMDKYLKNMQWGVNFDMKIQRLYPIIYILLVCISLLGSFLISKNVCFIGVFLFGLIGLLSFTNRPRPSFEKAVEFIVYAGVLINKWNSREPDGCLNWIKKNVSFQKMYNIIKKTYSSTL